MADSWRWEGDSLLLSLRVQPRASRDEWVGIQGDAVKVRITAAPVDGKANAALVKFLAREFGVGRSAITQTAGESSRNKRFRIEAPRKLPPGIERVDTP